MSESNESAIPSPKPRISKLAVAAFVLGILSIPTLSLTALPAVICAFLSLIKIARSSKRLKGVGWALAGMVVPVFFVFPVLIYFAIGFYHDAPPIPNDYTIADLHNADPQYNPSYKLLCSSFTDVFDDPNGAPAIGLSREDIDFIHELPGSSELSETAGREQISNNIDRINELWEKAAKGRSVIEQLQNFPIIADMEEPDLEAKTIETFDLKYLERLYCYYAVAQLVNGKQRDGISELLRMNQIVRAMSVPCRGLIKKMVCYGLFEMNINTAALYINDPNAPEEVIELIARHFSPLTKEQIGLQNAMIFDYIICRNEIQKLGIRGNPLLKYNSSVRLSRNERDYWINREKGLPKDNQYINVWPDWFWFMPQIDSQCEGMYPWYYSAYNPVGSPLLSILTPALGGVDRIKTKIQIEDDLFQYILARRLGKDGDLTARAYGQKYIVDIEKKRIYSSGPDGQAFTKDDIWLPIEPAVLGLAQKGQ
jgi:hypothetical protein